MVRRGWRNLLYLKYATAKAKAKHPLHLGKAAPSGTIENVGCELPPETKRRNLSLSLFIVITKLKTPAADNFRMRACRQTDGVFWTVAQTFSLVRKP